MSGALRRLLRDRAKMAGADAVPPVEVRGGAGDR
jgi:hypothetical protein